MVNLLEWELIHIAREMPPGGSEEAADYKK
jgi:hypothetical protein